MAATTSYYAIVRYVPDPIRGEQLNIGVVVTNGAGEFIDARVASDLQRAKTFGGEDTGFLKDFTGGFRRLPRQTHRTPRLEQVAPAGTIRPKTVSEPRNNSVQVN